MPLPALAVGALKWGLPALAGFLFGGGKKQSQAPGLDQLFKQFPQIQQLLDLQMRQAQRADPLQASIVDLATALLPRSAFGANYKQAGGNAPSYDTAVPRRASRTPLSRRTEEY